MKYLIGFAFLLAIQTLAVAADARNWSPAAYGPPAKVILAADQSMPISKKRTRADCTPPSHLCVSVSAPPGTGKTTTLPWLSGCHAVVLGALAAR